MKRPAFEALKRESRGAGVGAQGGEEEPVWTSDHFGLLLTLGGGEGGSEVAEECRTGAGGGRCAVI